MDATDRLIHPGLINAHTHGHGNLSKGMGDRWTLELLLTAAPWISGNRTAEDKYLSTYIGALEMLMKGCTACYDLTVEFPAPTPEGLGACAKAYADAGMRAVVAPMVANISFYEAIPGLLDVLPSALQKEVERLRMAPYEASLTAMRRVLTDWSFDRELVRPAVAPTIPHHCSDEFMRSCADLAREFGVGLHTHVHESKVQVIVGLKKYGKTPTAHLQDLGLLGPDFVAAHGVWLDDDDITRLADHGASVAHNPGSNMLLGNGIAAVKTMLEKKLNVGIGTDGASCCDNQNMYESLRVAAYGSNAKGPDTGRWLASEEILEAATAGSARALGFGDRIGRIAKGYKADLVFVDLDAHQLDPLQRPHQPAGAHRGRQRRAFRHGRRPDGGGEPPSRRPRSGIARKESRGRTRAPRRRQRRQQGPVRAPARPRQRLLPRPRQDPLPHRPLRRRPSRALMAFTTRHPVRTGSDPSHPRSGKAPRSGRGV